MSSLGSLAALLLLTGGILLCSKRPVGRTIAYWGAAVSIPTHFFGALIGLMSGHAVLYGAAYPIVLVLLLSRATPPSNAANTTEYCDSQSRKGHDAHLRSARA